MRACVMCVHMGQGERDYVWHLHGVQVCWPSLGLGTQDSSELGPSLFPQ